MIYSDLKLSQKLERTEARANAHFVVAHAQLDPELGAEWIEVGGAYAMFDGPDSPLTQTFGLGVFEKRRPNTWIRSKISTKNVGLRYFTR